MARVSKMFKKVYQKKVVGIVKGSYVNIKVWGGSIDFHWVVARCCVRNQGCITL